MGIDLAPSSTFFFLTSLGELLFIFIPLLVFYFQKKNVKEEFWTRIIPTPQSTGWRLMDILGGILFGIGFLYLGSFIYYWNRQLIIAIKGEEYFAEAAEGGVNTVPPTLAQWELILAIIVMFVIVALSEEYCFRGVLMREIKIGDRYPSAPGILLSSFLFGIYHVFPGIVPIQTFFSFFLYYFSFGMMLSLIVRIRRGDLIMAIIAHGTFNSILWYLRFA